MKESYQNYIAVIVAGSLYSLSYFYRGSIAPITDVLVEDFNATLSQIGLMSSLFWLSYCLLQIPTGVILQYIETECILLIGSFSFFIACTLFAVIPSNSIVLPSIFMLSCGILTAPFVLCFFNIVTTRFSTNALAMFGGVMQCANAILLVSGNMFQAYLYQQFSIWRPVYWAISLATMVCILLFIAFNVKRLHSPDGDVYSESDWFDDSTYLLPKKKGTFGIRFWKPLPQKKDAAHISNSVVYKIKMSVVNKWNWLISAHQYCCNTLQLAFNGLYLIQYMSLKYGISRELSTSISSTFWLSYAFGNVMIGKLAHKYRKRSVFYWISGWIQFIPPIYVVYGPSNVSVSVLVLCNVLSGIGNGISTLNFVLAREYNEYFECSDVASGLLNTLSVAAGFIMNWLIGILMDLHWEHRGGETDNCATGHRMYNVEDYNFGFVVIPIVGFVGIVSSFLIKETNGKAIVYQDDTKEISMQDMRVVP